MLLSEAEAKTKMCHRTMIPVSLQGHDAVCSPYACIASDCMAWRKKETSDFMRHAEQEFRRTGKRLESDTGYCGLVGQP